MEVSIFLLSQMAACEAGDTFLAICSLPSPCDPPDVNPHFDCCAGQLLKCPMIEMDAHSYHSLAASFRKRP